MDLNKEAVSRLKAKQQSEAFKEYAETLGPSFSLPNASTRVPEFQRASFIKAPSPLTGFPTVICSAYPDAAGFFWYMILKHHCTAIVKLTEDCFQEYYPLNDGKSKLFTSGIKVTNKGMVPGQHGVTRRLLEVEYMQSLLSVEHFQYSWPDFGVPPSTDAVRYILGALRGFNSYVIHCRAGIGRSGTLVTIDHVLRRTQAGDLSVEDMSSKVKYLREQRAGLVETKEQYWFCFQAVIEELESLLRDGK